MAVFAPQSVYSVISLDSGMPKRALPQKSLKMNVGQCRVYQITESARMSARVVWLLLLLRQTLRLVS